MRRLLYLAALSMVATLLFAPTALAQPDQCPVGTNLTEAGTCVPQDERCPPGQIFYEGPGTASGSCVPVDLLPGTVSPAVSTAVEAQYGIEPGTGPLVGGSDDVAQVGADGTLPDTGGSALLLPVAGLLVVTGLLGMRLVRRY